MRSDRTSFEVRCPRCEVTFPIGTRVCVHCGGRTIASHETPASDAALPGEASSPIFDFDSDFDSAFDPRSDERAPEAGSGFGPSAPYEQEQDSSAEYDRPRAPLATQASTDFETPNPGRSILGSMSSLIWIALLIAFSLSGRVCGE